LVDGLPGFPEAITTVFKNAQVHRCVVHLVRQSLRYVASKDKKQVVAGLKSIYNAPTADAALVALEQFEMSEYGRKYAIISGFWRNCWEFIEPIFSYPPEIRTLLYTTNAIESLNMQLRKIIKNRGHFPNDDAAFKLLYLALRNIIAKWSGASRQWAHAMPHLAMLFGNRFTNEV
jgi:transposase-like protein